MTPTPQQREKFIREKRKVSVHLKKGGWHGDVVSTRRSGEGGGKTRTNREKMDEGSGGGETIKSQQDTIVI